MKKILALITLLAIVCSLFVGCSFNQGDDNNFKEGEPVLTLLNSFYNFSKEYSFSLFKVVNIRDELYLKSIKWKYLIIECEVIESYEGPLKTGDKFNITAAVTPKDLRNGGDLSDDDRIAGVKDFLLGQDSFFGAFEIIREFHNHYTVDGEWFESELYTCRFMNCLEDGYYLPVNEGKLDFEPLEQYIKEFITNDEIGLLTYDDAENYFHDGMTAEELKESAEKLAGAINAAK